MNFESWSLATSLKNSNQFFILSFSVLLCCIIILETTAVSEDRTIHYSDIDNSSNNIDSNLTTDYTNKTSREYTTKPKEFLRIDCDIILSSSENNNTSADHLKWYHNGLEVQFADRYEKNLKNGQLIINNIRFDDNGLWNCQDSNENGSLISIIVLHEPKIPYFLIDNRRLDQGNLFIPIKENNNLTIQCVVEGGNPAPKLNWLMTTPNRSNILHKGEISATIPKFNFINNSTSSSTSADVGSSDGSSLITRSEAVISPVVRIHHNADVSCIVSHPALNKSSNATLRLDVQYAPSFGISREPGFGFPITEGISVSLKCDVDSNPPTTPIWQRDNTLQQSNDGFLNISSITFQDVGWYKCITRYQSTQYSSIGYFLNVRESVNHQAIQAIDDAEDKSEDESALEVTLGGEIQLECPTGGSLNCWGHSKYPGQRLESLKSGSKLLIDNIVYQQAGEYKCFAGTNSNKMEKWKSRTIHLNVTGSPVVYPKTMTVGAITNQRITFTLEFCANPPVTKAFWIRSLQCLLPGSSVNHLIAHNISESNTAYCQKAELTIKSVEIEDAGEYMFLVMSEKGIAGSTLTLNVTVSKTLMDEFRVENAAQNVANNNYKRSFDNNWLIIIIFSIPISEIFNNCFLDF